MCDSTLKFHCQDCGITAYVDFTDVAEQKLHSDRLLTWWHPKKRPASKRGECKRCHDTYLEISDFDSRTGDLLRSIRDKSYESKAVLKKWLKVSVPAPELIVDKDEALIPMTSRW
jgi:hypothetical protein